MKKTLITFLKITIPLGFGIFLIYLFYTNLTPEDIKNILQVIKDSNWMWLYLSIGLGLLSHIIRATRWHIPINEMGYKPKLKNSFFTVMVGYFANLGIPRSGEVIRCGLLSKYENIPVNKLIGTVIAERVVDLLLLIISILVALALHFSTMIELAKEYGVTNLFKNYKVMIPITIVVVFIFFLLKKLFSSSSNSFVKKVKLFFKGVLEGLVSITKMKKKWSFILQTLGIWVCYFLLFYVSYFALPEGTSPLYLSVAIVGFVVAGLSISLTNGGIGAYPIAIAYILSLFGIAKDIGYAFGWMVWIAQSGMIISFGLLSLILLPLVNKKS